MKSRTLHRFEDLAYCVTLIPSQNQHFYHYSFWEKKKKMLFLLLLYAVAGRKEEPWEPVSLVPQAPTIPAGLGHPNPEAEDVLA